MRKRNLIVIAIISLALILTSNTFGQRKNRKGKTNQPNTSSSMQKPTAKKPTGIITEIGMPIKAQTTPTLPKTKWEGPELDADKNSVKTNRPPTSGISQTPRRQQYNPKEYSIDKLKNSKKPPVQTTSPNNYIGETEKNVKKPTTQTRRRQTNQTNAAPNKFLSTIPTDYPNLKTKKPSTFIGSGEDGQSMKPKPRRSRPINRSNALPTNQTPKIKSKSRSNL